MLLGSKRILTRGTIILMILGWFFIFGLDWSSAVAPSVKINEVLYDAVSLDEGNEWIEIYNPTDSNIDLAGFSLEAGGSSFQEVLRLAEENPIILEPDNYYVIGEENVHLADLKVAQLGFQNGGSATDGIRILNKEGEVADTLLYDSPNSNNLPDDSGNPGENFAPDVKAGSSLGRDGQSLDTDNCELDFKEYSSPTPGEANEFEEEPEEPEELEEPEEDYSDSIFINELLPNPEGSDLEGEFIELVNLDSKTVDLRGWKIKDNSSRTYTISPEDFDKTQIKAREFLVIWREISGISLNNSNGDSVKLFQPNDNLLNEVSYEESAEEGLAWAQKSDGSFQWTNIPTPGEENIFDDPPSEEPIDDYISDIIINEFLPNPEGNDLEGEFIELKNLSSEEVSLVNWKLGDLTSKTFTITLENFDFPTIQPNDFLIVSREVSGISLNNFGGEAVKLYGPDDKLVDSVEYSTSAPEGRSYSLLEDGRWIWSNQITPGAENIFINNPPEVIFESEEEARVGEAIFFDASESFDPDSDAITFFWDFGDGQTSPEEEVNHSYSQPGDYEVTLTLEDEWGEQESLTKIIQVIDYDYSDKIFINELMINLSGDDKEGEWIELHNEDSRDINLEGWTLTDLKNDYKISEEKIIGSQNYLSFPRSETRITLNNDRDTIQLLDPQGKIVNAVQYEKSFEDLSLARIPGSSEWTWTEIVTPDEENQIYLSEEELDSEKKSSSSKSSQKSESQSTNFIQVTLQDIRKLEKGDSVETRGLVAVEPGILGKTIFYIFDQGWGTQIYSSKSDFPELKLGDLIEVRGKLSESSGESKVNIKEISDIVILDNQIDSLIPLIISDQELGEDLEGSLVTIEGKVVEQSGSSLYVDYGGPEEIKVFFKSTTGLKRPKLEDGQLIKITGIVSQTTSGFRLLPRYENDIEIPRVLGEETGNSVLEIQPDNKNQEIFKYLGLTWVGVIIILGGLFWKKYDLGNKLKSKFMNNKK